MSLLIKLAIICEALLAKSLLSCVLLAYFGGPEVRDWAAQASATDQGC